MLLFQLFFWNIMEVKRANGTGLQQCNSYKDPGHQGEVVL